MVGNLHVLRPMFAATDSGERSDLDSGWKESASGPSSELMGYATGLRERVAALPAAHPDEARHVMVLTAEPARYEFLQPIVEARGGRLFVTNSSFTGMAWISTSLPVCAAIVSEVALLQGENGYRACEAYRAVGFNGPLLMVMSRAAPLAADRAYARKRGADEIVRFHEPAMQRWIERALVVSEGPGAAVRTTAVDVPSRAVGLSGGYPGWLSQVIVELAYFIGPLAGDLVRQEYVDLRARFGASPDAEVLIESLGESLGTQVPDWNDIRREFVNHALAAIKGSKR